MKKDLLTQLFKHDADTGTGSGGGNGADVSSSNGADSTDDFTPPTTQSELDSLIGKAVDTALKNQQAKHQKALDEAVQTALAKEKDYSKLSAEQRERKEYEDEKTRFEEEKAQFALEKLTVQIEKDLVSKGLPVELAGTFALAGDEKSALEAVTAFKSAFDKAVAEEVKKSVRQNEPGQRTGTAGAQNYGADLAKRNGVGSSEKLF